MDKLLVPIHSWYYLHFPCCICQHEHLEIEIYYMQGKINEKKLNEFSMKETYYDLLDKGEKGKVAVDLSVDNHAEVIKEQCHDIYDAIDMINFIQDHIEYRLKQYTKCIAKSTPNYFKYLMETYNRQLRQTLRAIYED